MSFASGPVGHRRYARLTSAVSTAEERALRFDSVTQDFTATVVAYWRQLVNGTLETVEGMRLAGRDYLKREIVIVAADFTASHL
jgi:hypothetical protein